MDNGSETAMAEEERRILTTQTPKILTDTNFQSQPETKRAQLLLTTSPGGLSQQRQTDLSIGTSGMSTKRSRKLEKTMIKVMDPNVHQVMVNPEDMIQ